MLFMFLHNGKTGIDLVVQNTSRMDLNTKFQDSVLWMKMLNCIKLSSITLKENTTEVIGLDISKNFLFISLPF